MPLSVIPGLRFYFSLQRSGQPDEMERGITRVRIYIVSLCARVANRVELRLAEFCLTIKKGTNKHDLIALSELLDY